MNPTPKKSPLRRIVAWFLLFSVAFVVVLAVALWNLLTPSRSVRVARDALAGGTARSTVVQFDAGYVSTWWIRQGIGIARGLPEEARLAVATLRGASVGVYHLAPAVEEMGSEGENADLSDADESLAALGYVRTVDVRSARGERVAVWLACPESGGRLKACVAVRKDKELVVVSAELDGESLCTLVDLASDEQRVSQVRFCSF